LTNTWLSTAWPQMRQTSPDVIHTSYQLKV
jgi:hypothetical protein